LASFTVVRTPVARLPVVEPPVAPVGSRQPLAGDAVGTKAAPELAWLFPQQERLDWEAIDTAPVPPKSPAPERGRELFAKLCSACHGDHGRGDGPLAAELARPPRDLVLGSIRTRRTRGLVSADELFRTITAGASEFGMPSFAHLPRDDRWCLVGRVAELRRGQVAWSNVEPVELPRRPVLLDERDGARTFARLCSLCHGPTGDGRGFLADGLTDEQGKPAPPAPFARGLSAFRGGGSVESIVRTVLVGRAGTRMVPIGLADDELWDVAAFVSSLSRRGEEARRGRWSAFFEKRRALANPGDAKVSAPLDRWDAKVSATFEVAEKPGCVSCHLGVAEIASGRMALALEAVSGGDRDRECCVCHEGDTGAREKDRAHRGLVGNPGSLWVTSLGLGCGKCHSNRGALTSLMSLPFPEPVGGSLLAVVSRKTDPTGACGSNHAYRIQRALMAQETGKVLLETASAGLVAPDAPRFTDFPVDDPDGPVPCVGSEAYKEFVARGLATGHLTRLERGEALPTYEGALELAKGRGTTASDARAAAGYVDYFRKDCARCHLWGEGKDAWHERRSSGCSACHVLNDDSGKDQGGDPTVPFEKPGHPSRHELTLAIPEEQCNHCHTRGTLTRHTEVHDRAGLGCVDCHTSIDVHGDGNLYPSIRHQLEIRCEDCHGSPAKLPWELPVGNGSKAASRDARGVLSLGNVEHLLTDRGNARANWLREGARAFVVSFADGKRHEVPFLRERLVADGRNVAAIDTATPGSAFAHGEVKHGSLACSACHSGASPRCGTCHLNYSRLDEAQDFLLSASNYDATTRQRVVVTKGNGEFREPPGWGSPEMRRDERGRFKPQVRGCDVLFTFLGEKEDDVLDFHPQMNPGDPDYPPPVAPTLSHENSLTARKCDECHVDGVVVLPGSW
jgi:mono/diheme cytochrome c family protein